MVARQGAGLVVKDNGVRAKAMSNWRVFDFGDEDWLRWSLPGVYAIYGDGRLLYIGQSSNVSHRLLTGHRALYARYSTAVELPWGRFKRVTIKIRRSERFGDWLMHEARLIRRLKPEGNIRGTSRRRRRASDVG